MSDVIGNKAKQQKKSECLWDRLLETCLVRYIAGGFSLVWWLRAGDCPKAKIVGIPAYMVPQKDTQKMLIVGSN